MLEAEQIMKRCQVGTRNYNEANNLHAACYGVIGKLLSQRTWVGLTDDEHCDIWYKESLDWMEYGKAIEAKLKQKNGYAEEKNT
jgi:hypothetical protein